MTQAKTRIVRINEHINISIVYIIDTRLTPGTGRTGVVGEVTVAEISVPARSTLTSLLTRLGLTEVPLALTARHHGTYTGSGQGNIYDI